VALQVQAGALRTRAAKHGLLRALQHSPPGRTRSSPRAPLARRASARGFRSSRRAAKARERRVRLWRPRGARRTARPAPPHGSGCLRGISCLRRFKLTGPTTSQAHRARQRGVA
jgi:hypothetical protein